MIPLKLLIKKIKPQHIIVLLLAMLLIGYSVAIEQKKTIARLTSSFKVSQDSLKTYRAKDGSRVTTSGIQELTIGEIKKIYPAIKADMDNMKLQIGRVSQIQMIGSSTKKEIVAPLKDSTGLSSSGIGTLTPYSFSYHDLTGTSPGVQVSPGVYQGYNNSILAMPHMQTFAYNDPYFSMSGYIKNDSIHPKIVSRDTLMNVVYKQRDHPWMWIFSPTSYTQVLNNKNPDNIITYNKTIQVKRK